MKTKNKTQFMQKILQIISPSKEEEEIIARVCNRARRMLQDCLKKANINAEAEIGGSVAKGTWLKDINDIDIYVKFNKGQYSNRQGKNISDILALALKSLPIAIQRMHGSRDYFQICLTENSRQFTIEIIPILNISRMQEAENITDLSPLHVRYVEKHKSLAHQIRLAKALCKANNIYGAESYIKGFSGYALEILTIYYGSFTNLIQNISIWKNREVIDPSVYYSSKEEILEKMNMSKQQSPLILIDPVQEDRNAAAAVGQECYKIFIRLAKQFLKKPAVKFFIKKQFDADKLIAKFKKQKSKEIVVIKLHPETGKEDIIGAKLLKAFEKIKGTLADNGFKILNSGWSWEKTGKDKCWFWFVFPKKPLSKTYRHYGPPIKYKARLNDFKKKWKGKKIYYEKKDSYVILKRKCCKAENLIKEIASSKELKHYSLSFCSKRLKKP
ncbi:CCA tRNA nucleotidyltransferase [archaeon]|nr:CCA tRNA nucleotidyltransferase [archaeon]